MADGRVSCRYSQPRNIVIAEDIFVHFVISYFVFVYEIFSFKGIINSKASQPKSILRTFLSWLDSWPLRHYFPNVVLASRHSCKGQNQLLCIAKTLTLFPDHYYHRSCLLGAAGCSLSFSSDCLLVCARGSCRSSYWVLAS